MWATHLGCAERKAGVDAMRDYKVTFLWMSELVAEPLLCVVNVQDLTDRFF
jgi:hypothetical protein